MPPTWWFVLDPPLPFLHAVRWERTLIKGSPCGLLGVQYPPPLHAIIWECTLLGGAPSSSSLIGESPHLSWSCCSLVAHAAVRVVPPLRSALSCMLFAHTVCPPPPPARAQFVRAVGDRGPLLVPVPCHAVGSRAAVFGSLPMPPMRAVGARFWVGGPPPPPPPSSAARVKRAQLFGGSLASFSPPSGSCTGSARCGFSSALFAILGPALFSVAPWPSSPAAAPTLA